MQDYLMNTYNRLPIEFVKGNGAWLYDKDNEQYLDALSGIAVNGLGHNHPSIVQTIKIQAEKILHICNLYQISESQVLAAKLCKATQMHKAFICNSGAEAVEAAIKIAHKFGHDQNILTPKILVMTGAFHGRTMACISASSNKRIQNGFQPLLPGFVRVPYDDISAIESMLNKDENIVAIMLEPIQGEGGIVVPHEKYLSRVREICNKFELIMILDEVQCGLGRTGSLYEFMSHKILPDVLLTAKGLANGFPIGACLVAKNLSDIFKPGDHGSTFGGNPFACAVANATLDAIINSDYMENAKIQGAKLLKELKHALKHNSHVVQVRGKGLMVGIELDKPCREILMLALKKKLLFNVASDKVIRLLPPLIIDDEQVDYIIKTIPTLIDEFYNQQLT